MRKSLQLLIACLTLVVGLAILLAAFIVPPVGIIDSSVLVAYGETLTFVGSLMGIDYHYRYKH